MAKSIRCSYSHNLIYLPTPTEGKRLLVCCLLCMLEETFFFKIAYLFIFGCAGSSLLSGLSLVVVHRLLIFVSSFVAKNWLQGSGL